MERAPTVTALDEKLELLTKRAVGYRAGGRPALAQGVIAEHARITRMACSFSSFNMTRGDQSTMHEIIRHDMRWLIPIMISRGGLRLDNEETTLLPYVRVDRPTGGAQSR